MARGFALLTPALIRPVPFNRTRPRNVRGQTTERNTIMTSNTKTRREPSYEVFTVEKGAEGKAVWTKIRAACPHKDGKGFFLKGFTLGGGLKVHLRAVEAKAQKGAEQ